MKTAIPIWQGRISPVFDVAGQLLLIESSNGNVVHREERKLDDAHEEARADAIKFLGVDMLVCASISHGLETELIERGVSVIANVCGDVEDVLEAYLAGELDDDRFAMPGCCRQRRRRHRGDCGRRQRRC